MDLGNNEGKINYPRLQGTGNSNCFISKCFLCLCSKCFILSALNTNSIRNKFEQLNKTVLKYIDILVVTETKLDETFLKSLFLMDGFSKPYRLYKNNNGGRIMIFIRDTTSSKLLEKHIFLNHVKSILVKRNFRKCKWLLYVT